MTQASIRPADAACLAGERIGDCEARKENGLDRIERVREKMDRVIRGLAGENEKRDACIHLYGVSQFCAMIAMKRGVNVELAVIAGMMHDIYTYSAGETKDHAHKGAEMARQVLISMGSFEDGEVEQICSAVYHHSSKKKKHGELDEVLKDADVFQHCIYHPGALAADKERERWEALKREFGIR